MIYCKSRTPLIFYTPVPTGVYKRTPEHIEKLKAGQMRFRNSPAYESFKNKERLANFLEGGKKTRFKKGQPGNRLGVKLPSELVDRMKNRTHSKETREKISIANRLAKKGKHPPNWIEDRTKLKKQNRRNDSLYKEWRMSVWRRDNFKCRIGDSKCQGRIEAHHILGWSEYPELRYQVNNGITLCHAHHPRRRAEEKRLSPFFQSLVSVSKE